MAKTVFSNGTVVTSSYLNTIFGSGAGGGHLHDGANDDGHCPKINLAAAAEVTGLLPQANVASLTTDLSALQGIHSVGDITLTFPDTQFTAQQQITARYLIHNLGTNYRYVKIGFPRVLATSNSATLAPTEKLPAVCCPAINVMVPCMLVDNNIPKAGWIYIDNDGTVLFELAAVSGSQLTFNGSSTFTSSNSKGFREFVIEYPKL